jgi:hypothetical protein
MKKVVMIVVVSEKKRPLPRSIEVTVTDMETILIVVGSKNHHLGSRDKSMDSDESIFVQIYILW